MNKRNSQETHRELNLDKEIYPLDIIYTTAYVFLERAYIFLKKGKENEIVVQIEPKENEDPETLSKEFNNQLINYAHHMKMNEKNMDVKKKLLEEIFAYNFVSHGEEKKFDFEQDDDIEDPEGILVPWEEKYENDQD